jgi:hypothetical protein
VRLGRQVVYYIIQGVIIQGVINDLAIGIYDFNMNVLIKSVGYKKKKRFKEYLE